MAMISPASFVRSEFVEGAKRRIEAAGYKVRVYPSALGPSDGSYAAPVAKRLADFKATWTDKDVRAIICTRGGYGCVHLLEGLTPELLKTNPKWLVGFSDVSALHAMLLKEGVASVHGSMARYIAEDAGVLDGLLSIIGSDKPGFSYTIPNKGDYKAKTAKVRGQLKGGNLAVLSHLIGTPYDIFSGEGDILFIEDVSEAIYASERMLWQLKLAGVLDKAAGIVVGSFTETRADKNFPDTESMIYKRLTEWGIAERIPVVSGFPIGHIPENIPLIQGAEVELSVDDSFINLKTID